MPTVTNAPVTRKLCGLKDCDTTECSEMAADKLITS